MRDDLTKDLFPTHGEAIDPVEMARRDLRKNLPKRFYKEATVEPRDGAFVLLLDGRPARTPARAALALPNLEAGKAIAAEWAAQAEIIDPATMPLTRLVNSALDGVAANMAETAAEVVKFAGSDLVCYRVAEPDSLVLAQAEAWNPVLAFARDALDARFVLAEGVMFVRQPEAALAAVEAAVATAVGQGASAPLRLAALNVMTNLTGSALIALAVAKGALTAQAGWEAAHVDETFQEKAWGADSEAEARRARRWSDMEAAATLYRLLTETM